MRGLIKKYKSFKTDILQLRSLLLTNPKAGISLGNSCFKIRLAISSKNKGKSGGARIITNVVCVNKVEGTVFLLAAYDKSVQENISDKQIAELLAQTLI